MRWLDKLVPSLAECLLLLFLGSGLDLVLVMMVMEMVKMMNMKMITGVRFAKMGPIWLQNGADTGHYRAFWNQVGAAWAEIRRERGQGRPTRGQDGPR